jgi:transposase
VREKRYNSRMSNPQADNRESGPAPRYQRAVRRQMHWEERSLDQLLPLDAEARIVWEFVQKLDLSEFYAEIKAVEGHVGRPPVDPAILLSLWILATVNGIGSARALEQLCKDHIAYEWLCGGVGVNYHLLSDFRSSHPERLERIMVRVLATLMDQDLVTLARVAQDGMRVRGHAGGSSFRRKAGLEQHLAEAQAQVDALKNDVDEDAGAADRRSKAAQERAARERVERLEEALKQVDELAEKMDRRKAGDGDKARCSTTDPDARRMKMADGGTRPAYNVQLVTTDETRLIVGWDVNNIGSDNGLMEGMRQQIASHYGHCPEEWLVDGGYSTIRDIEALAAAGTTVYSPVKQEASKRAQGKDPFAPQKGDSSFIADWRKRMGTAIAQQLYKLRPSIAEYPNAVLRNRGLRQFPVRGLEKVKSVALWQVLSYNFTRIQSLGWLANL